MVRYIDMDSCYLILQVDKFGHHKAVIETENGDRFELTGVSSARLNLEPSVIPSWTLNIFTKENCEIK